MKKSYLRFIFFAFALCSSGLVLAQEHVTRVFAHRAGRAEQDENTLSAFQATYTAGINGFETDVRMTKDGNLIISHDNSLQRMTTSEGIIEEMETAELKKVVTKKGHKLLFLDELLDFLKDKPNLYVEFEMKTSETNLYPDDRIPEYCEKVYKAIKAKMPEDADFSMTSFDYRPLRYMRQHHPDMALLYISGNPCCDQTIEVCKTLGIKRMGVTLGGTSRDAVVKAHKEGLTVSLWPGTKVEDTILGIALGADLLCTDIPQQVKNMLKVRMPEVKVKY
ncbi:glycerophosphodiester phosphodiesterase [Phocaeicola oris]|uniref:glycerophosphodiester phosphodiesterase n=1 Tax=Phocaeicola oris TaxID=2896850 RepID=UPI00234FB510|nr:glycerophosphodiester phosphodiesterase [Phocaeicola oris]MCE2616594.1 glycerophosphodiester phosphodiesterase [Phocaeicola oris]